MKKYICDGLADYLSKDRKPWHMPGHKRRNFIDELKGEAAWNMAAFSALDDEAGEWAFNIDTILALGKTMDVTEVSGTDDLHHPEEMILKSQQQLSEIYGSYASYYMVNGSTGGILSAIGAVADAGKAADNNKIIIARNCHKSVYNAVKLFDLQPIYVEPEYVELECGEGKSGESVYMSQTDCDSYIYGAIKPQQIKLVVEQHKDVCAVVITSPTYEGVVSDVEGIKKVLELYNIPLIVDEAHGAHLPFMAGAGGLPASAVSLGADIVVQSLHKTLPALTQTAVIHVNNEKLCDGVQKYLSVFMSSSPSYLMLCAMEQAVVDSWEWKLHNGYEEYLKTLRDFRENIGKLTNIKLLGNIQEKSVAENQVDKAKLSGYEDREHILLDETRIVLYTSYPGELIGKRLRELGNIEIEMSGVNYVVLISTYMDSLEDFEHLKRVIKLLDEELGSQKLSLDDSNKAVDKALWDEQLYKLVGTCATDNIYVYPPGSYIVAAGEVITEEAVDKILKLRESGKRIVGI